MNKDYSKRYDKYFNEPVECYDYNFDDELRHTIVRYDIKNYMFTKYRGEWEKLSEEKKLEYCYTFFDIVMIDDFFIARQVEIFQKLIHLDFENFCYINVIECLFPQYNCMGLVFTSSIVYNPLIPKKHYMEYITKKHKESNISHMNIPLENSGEYFKELLLLWYLYNYKKKSIYEIANEYYDLNYQKQIRQKINSIEKLYNHSIKEPKFSRKAD